MVYHSTLLIEENFKKILLLIGGKSCVKTTKTSE